jgi:hypothetical protein
MKPIGKRRLALHAVLGSLTAGALLLAGYAAPPSPVIETPPTATTSFSTVSPLPPRAPLFQIGPPSVREGEIGAAPNHGPVTGYGAGGMGRIPGSPPNPPYH